MADYFGKETPKLGFGLMRLPKKLPGTEERHRTTDCVGCRQCERACPQHLKIVDYLKQCGKMLGA